MVQNYNSDLSNELRKAGAIQTGIDSIPNKISDTIQPVIEVNPSLLRISTVLAQVLSKTSSAATLTLLGSKQNQDVFITGISVDNTQDAACDNTLTSVLCTLNGESGQALFTNRKQTTTAQSYNITRAFNPPIKIDRGTIITYSHGFTAGNSTLDLVLYGYIINNSNA